MVEKGLLIAQTAEAMKQEVRMQLAANIFFGFMSYVSQLARKPLVK